MHELRILPQDVRVMRRCDVGNHTPLCLGREHAPRQRPRNDARGGSTEFRKYGLAGRPWLSRLAP